MQFNSGLFFNDIGETHRIISVQGIYYLSSSVILWFCDFRHNVGYVESEIGEIFTKIGITEWIIGENTDITNYYYNT
jgi:hypothetical protein